MAEFESKGFSEAFSFELFSIFILFFDDTELLISDWFFESF
jgi:hypothetical protein